MASRSNPLLPQSPSSKGGESGKNVADTRTLIQTIGTISRTVGYRLGRHIERLVPLFLRICGDPDDEALHTDAANELRETSFPGLESFVLRCPREVLPCLFDIVQTSLDFLKYDPNYSYDEEESEEDMETSDAEDDDEYEDYIGSDEDDDTSWKVRKAAVKVIYAAIKSRPDLQTKFYESCADELISRFREREDNVRVDVLACFTSVLLVGQGADANCAMGSSDSFFRGERNILRRSCLSSYRAYWENFLISRGSWASCSARHLLRSRRRAPSSSSCGPSSCCSGTTRLPLRPECSKELSAACRTPRSAATSRLSWRR